MGLSGNFSDAATGATDVPLYVVVRGVNLDDAVSTAHIRCSAYVSKDAYDAALQPVRPMDQLCADGPSVPPTLTETGEAVPVEPITDYTDWFSPQALEAAAQAEPPVDAWHQAYAWLKTLEQFQNCTDDGEM